MVGYYNKYIAYKVRHHNNKYIDSNNRVLTAAGTLKQIFISCNGEELTKNLRKCGKDSIPFCINSVTILYPPYFFFIGPHFILTKKIERKLLYVN